MERNDDMTVDNLAKDVRILILSFCDLQTARIILTNKAWYECSKITNVWKQIYSNTCAEFNPKPKDNCKDWKAEVNKKIDLYGHNFDKYRDLLGVVKLSYKIDPPMDFKVDTHIHRTLHLEVNGNLLPCMGYFGPSDVCYGDWIREVFEPLFDIALNGEHIWDFCDQGMPAFKFVVEGPICKLSIIEGICGGEADPEWQEIEFLIEDLRAEYIKFLQELHRELLANYGHDGQTLWNSFHINWKKYQ